MIDSNNPEINVDELMNKVREEVAKRHTAQTESYKSIITPLNIAVNSHKIEALITNAELRSKVRKKWPDNLNRFPFNISKKFQKVALKGIEILFRDQHEVNFNLIQALKETLLFNRQLIEQTAILQAQNSAIDDRIKALSDRVAAIDNYLKAVDERIGAVDSRMCGLDERVGAIDNYLKAVDERIGAVDSRMCGLDERVGATDNYLKAVDERIGAVDSRMCGLDERVGATDNYLKAVDERIGAVDSRMCGLDERVGATDNYLKAVDERVGAVKESFSSMEELLQPIAANYAETKVGQNLPSFLEVTNTSYINSAISSSPIPIEEHYKHDKKELFYHLFENVFYNSELVKQKQKFYIQFINKELNAYHRFLDVGCGRGEFLKNLTESHISCKGVDINNLEISMLKNRGFDVLCTDLIDYLENVDEQYSGISALQVCEHLSNEQISKFLGCAFNRLTSDSVLIIETVNPHSLYALSNFYQDQTHIKPLPPEALKFLLEWHGFKDIKIIYSSLVPEDARIFRDQRMNYQDYALVGYKR